VPKTDTQGTENLDKAISFDQKGASTYLLPLSRYVSTKWPTVASPYIPDTVVSRICPCQRFTISLVTKRLGGWVRAYSLAGNGVVQESKEEARTL
jgi:hypothetical protein